MDSRDLAIFLIGLLVGTGIGYLGQNMIKEYVSPYTFVSRLTISGNTTASYSVLYSVEAVLVADIPPELLYIPDIEEYVLGNKPIQLYMKRSGETYWSIVSTVETVYRAGKGGVALFSVDFSPFVSNMTGIFVFKAQFQGSPLLKSCVSNELIVTVD